MNEIIRPVRYGILIGLLGFIFGIAWAFWLVLGHEKIHKQLEQGALKAKEEHSLLEFLEPNSAMAHTDAKTEGGGHSHGQPLKDTHQHGEEGASAENHEHEQMMEADQHMMQMGEMGHYHGEGMHDSPIMELAHKRLARGHLHAMGLGLLTIALSFILAFTSAPDRIKTVASVLTGLGGIIYPIAWMVMGYRTPALGPDAAEASVTIIAGPGIALVLLGIFTAGIFLLKDIFSGK